MAEYSSSLTYKQSPMLDDIKKTLWGPANKLRANMDAAAMVVETADGGT
jgi:hypothetical protein